VYFLVHTRAGTPIPRMITAAGLRWNIEDDNCIGTDMFGLDQYQIRKWMRGTGTAAAIPRDLWRQAHQTHAMISHYRRRGDPLPTRLRT
jgi:hypothetical protein